MHEDLLAAWHRRARESQFAHYTAANSYSLRNRWLGIPTVLLTALVGTSVFATLEEAPSTRDRLILGLISLAAAILASLHTFLAYPELAEKHRAAGARYGALRRHIEQIQVLPPMSDQLVDEVSRLREQLDDLSSRSPDVPVRFWRKAQTDIKNTTRPGGFVQKT